MKEVPLISRVVPTCHQTAKVIFNDNKTADFKYIWLRDNCKCSVCVDENTRQKKLDTPALDVQIRPQTMTVSEDLKRLNISWPDSGHSEHVTSFDNSWLYRYGQCFMHDTFVSNGEFFDEDETPPRANLQLWNSEIIGKELMKMSYDEFMQSDESLLQWLEAFHRYGVAKLVGVPTEYDQLREVVNRFAYIKETQYGVTFSVKIDPTPGSHLFATGMHLELHTDLNYRETSPGMQLLHCLKAENPTTLGRDPGGKSFFVDGFRVAKWMEDNEPAAYHILTSTPIRFSIFNDGQRYMNMWPVIVTDTNGDVQEIHYNNRTMGPLQAPDHVVVPFYHAYRQISMRMRNEKQQLAFHLTPGDLVAFNNRRVLHGRTSFDPTAVTRHLRGCYVDIDEAISMYDKLRTKKQ